MQRNIDRQIILSLPNYPSIITYIVTCNITITCASLFTISVVKTVTSLADRGKHNFAVKIDDFHFQSAIKFLFHIFTSLYTIRHTCCHIRDYGLRRAVQGVLYICHYAKRFCDVGAANVQIELKILEIFRFRGFSGAAGQIRTADLILTKDALYLLSYSSKLYAP